MNHRHLSDSLPEHPIHALPRLLPALILLWRHYRDAAAVQQDSAGAGVPHAALRQVGATQADLESLIAARYVSYAALSRPDPSMSNGHATPSPAASQSNFLILTPAGAAFMLQVTQTLEQSTHALAPINNGHAHDKPHWDPVRSELRYRDVVVKRFHKPAPNQELILAAFQESGWPRHIDDPLPPVQEIVPSVRLHDTLGRLNRTLQTPLLHFGCDRAGQGVCWRLR